MLNLSNGTANAFCSRKLVRQSRFPSNGRAKPDGICLDIKAYSALQMTRSQIRSIFWRQVQHLEIAPLKFEHITPYKMFLMPN